MALTNAQLLKHDLPVHRKNGPIMIFVAFLNLFRISGAQPGMWTFEGFLYTVRAPTELQTKS